MVPEGWESNAVDVSGDDHAFRSSVSAGASGIFLPGAHE